MRKFIKITLGRAAPGVITSPPQGDQLAVSANETPRFISATFFIRCRCLCDRQGPKAIRNITKSINATITIAVTIVSL